jgi:hypothetical protein
MRTQTIVEPSHVVNAVLDAPKAELHTSEAVRPVTLRARYNFNPIQSKKQPWVRS